MQNFYQIVVHNPDSETGHCKSMLLKELLTNYQTKGVIHFNQFSKEEVGGW